MILALLLMFTTGVLAAESVNLALGKPYTITIKDPVAAYQEIESRDYPDTNGVELTDGVKVDNPEDYRNPGFVGFLRQGGRDIVIDLGKNANVTSVTAHLMGNPSLGIGFPVQVVVSLSDDGKLWGPPMAVALPDAFFAEFYTAQVRIAGSARYVKVFLPTNVWVFCDEIEVIGTWAE